MLPEPLLAELRDVLAARTGLAFERRNWRDLERRVEAASREAGAPDVEHYVNRLLSGPLQHQQVETLARHLTVGETYFFREKHSFEALGQHVLPALLRERGQGTRRLRLWSAGCCTGEEAYSIAILLDRLLPQQPGWDISILATDINRQFLERAERGVYGEWSFRGTPDWVKNGYFRRTRGQGMEVLPHIRERVRFSYLNLADETWPATTDATDIILCRNVLMYFTPAQARAVVTRFRRALRDDGLLLVSPAETSATLFTGYSPVNFPGAIFYAPGTARRTVAEPVTAHLRRPPLNHNQSNARKPEVHAAHTRVRPAVAPSRTVVEHMSPVEAVTFSRNARDCANEGRLDEAATWCERAIAADKLDAGFHYLLASIEQERGRNTNAALALQRALFLDPDFALAHFALGNLRLSEGRIDEAGRHFANLRIVLGKLDRDEILPEAGGLTAGRLDEIVLSLCARLTDPSLAVGI